MVMPSCSMKPSAQSRNWLNPCTACSTKVSHSLMTEKTSAVPMPPKTSSDPRNTDQAANMFDITRRHRRTTGHRAQVKMMAINVGMTTTVSRKSATTMNVTTTPIMSNCSARIPIRPIVSVHSCDTLNVGRCVFDSRSSSSVFATGCLQAGKTARHVGLRIPLTCSNRKLLWATHPPIRPSKLESSLRRTYARGHGFAEDFKSCRVD
jgi:hypothetical protein